MIVLLLLVAANAEKFGSGYDLKGINSSWAEEGIGGVAGEGVAGEGVAGEGVVQVPITTNLGPLNTPKRKICYEFPQTATAAYVKVTPKIDKEFEEFTFDIQYKMTKKITSGKWYGNYVLTYNLFDQPRLGEFAIELEPHGSFYTSSEGWMGTTKAILNKETRYTIISASNIYTVYVNGKEKSKGTRPGYKIKAGGSWILGQEQDTFGGGFQESQRFIGTLCGFRFWSRALSQHEIATLFNGGVVEPGDMFDNPTSSQIALAGNGAHISTEISTE